MKTDTEIVDFTDTKQLVNWWSEHIDDDTCIVAHTPAGETQTISTCENDGERYVHVQTYQTNGWVREDYYYLDGTTEQLFSDRWE